MYKVDVTRTKLISFIGNNFFFLIAVVGYFQGIHLIFFNGLRDNTNILIMLPYIIFGLFCWFLAKDKYPKNRNIAKRVLLFFPMMILGCFIPYYIFLRLKEKNE